MGEGNLSVACFLKVSCSEVLVMVGWIDLYGLDIA